MILFLRQCAVIFAFCYMSVIGCLIGIFRPFNLNNNMLIAKGCAPFFFKLLGFRVIIRNAERLTEHQPAIYISNHQNALDSFLFGINIPPRTLVIGKKSILYIPFFGLMFWLAGNYLIERKRRGRAMATMDQVRDRMLKDHSSILLMPEGTRNRDKGIGPFKKGAFYLAVQTGYPIIPLVASSLYKNVDLSKWRAGKVIIDVLPPIFTKGKTEKDIESLMNEARTAMVAKFQESIKN